MNGSLMKNKIKISCVIAFLFALLTGVIVYMDRAWSAEEGLKSVILKVEGMTSASNAPMLKTALNKLDGVVRADVSFKDADAIVEYREDKVSVDRIIQAIGEAGFKADLPKERSEKLWTIQPNQGCLIPQFKGGC